MTRLTTFVIDDQIRDRPHNFVIVGGPVCAGLLHIRRTDQRRRTVWRLPSARLGVGRNMPQGTGLPLILAVEADSRQAAELSSLFENEFSAELVLASSAQQALKAIGTRIPDLVLTSALIPPKDESALTAWLRNLGDAAAHVQTVTIPALATPKSNHDRPRHQGALPCAAATVRFSAGQLRPRRVCRLCGAVSRPRIWRAIASESLQPSARFAAGRASCASTSSSGFDDDRTAKPWMGASRVGVGRICWSDEHTGTPSE